MSNKGSSIERSIGSSVRISAVQLYRAVAYG